MTLPADPVKWALKMFQDDRTDRYNTYQEYVTGDQPLAFATLRFESTFGRLFEAFSYNRCELVIDAHADRLRVSGFGADTPTLATDAQLLWDANRMDVREGHVESDAFTYGDSYVIVEMHPDRGDVQLWTQDPRTVRVHYSSEAPGELDLAVKRWVTEDGRTRLTLYFADRIEKYISRTRTPGGLFANTAMERFEVNGEEWPVALGVPDTVPVFHFANNGRTNAYGVSELRSVLPLQDALNKTLMDMLVAMEFAAFPQRVLIGVQGSDDPEEALEEDRQLAAFVAGLQRIMTLEDPNAKIGEFSAVNIAQYLSVAEFWDKAVSRVTKVPMDYMAGTSDAISGRSRRLREAAFTAKIEDRQRAFGGVWSDIMTYGVRLKGAEAKPGAIRVNWVSAAPLSAEDQLDLAEAKKAVGLPFEQIVKELGYEPAQITEILAMARRASDQAMGLFNAGAISPFVTTNEEVA
jgi:hypothetical protein